MNCHLHIIAVGNCQAAVDSARRRAPVLMQLEAHSSSANLFHQWFGSCSIPLAQEAEIQRKAFNRLVHAGDIPWARRTGRGVGPSRWPRPPTDHGGNAAILRFIDLLGRDEMNMGIDATGSEDESLAGHNFSASTDFHARSHPTH